MRMRRSHISLIPAKAGIQKTRLDSRLRGNERGGICDQPGRAALGVALVLLLALVLAAPAHAFTAYVSNEKGNTVTVIDTEKFEAVRTIKVGQRPRGIEVTRDGKFVLVA